MKKTLLLLLLYISFINITTAQTKLTMLWATDTVLAVPESVLFDAGNSLLYAALINGKSNEADGKGGIAKIGLDGKVIDSAWITGLNAPKGMGKQGNTLYVADLTEVAAIDISTGKILKKIKIAGAAFLNDVDIDGKGNVFVSDSETGKVHKIENGNAAVYVENFKRPNGVMVKGNDLYVLASGSLYKVDASKKVTTLADGMEASTDGIMEVSDGNFIISCWAGVIYYVTGDGKKTQLLDTRGDKINSADIGYDAKNKIVYVPTFFKNNVVAYQLD